MTSIKLETNYLVRAGLSQQNVLRDYAVVFYGNYSNFDPYKSQQIKDQNSFIHEVV